MNPDELAGRLSIVPAGAIGRFRVTARESPNLEFKSELSLAVIKRTIKTIAGFANGSGGCVVFGVADRPRDLVGVNPNALDEGEISEQISQTLSPSPEIRIFDVMLHGATLVVLEVKPLRKPPCITTRRLADGADRPDMLSQGVIYARRSGQTKAMTGEEFTQLLAQRDETVRSEIFGFLKRGRDVGFERAVVANSVNSENGNEMVLYVPAEAASKLNIIDRARVVQNEGAPAYEMRGTVQLAVPNDEDPRKPMRAEQSAEEIRERIEELFWVGIPWNFSHMKRATNFLGFWRNENGDGVNTGKEPLTNTTIYFEAGRTAILNLALQNPEELIEYSTSKKTQEEWQRRKGL